MLTWCAECTSGSLDILHPTGHLALPGGLFCAIGNPLNDGTWTCIYQNGRQLARMQSVDTDASFVYNENGLRVQKTVNGVVTNYTLHGKNVVHMTQGSDELHFFYDAGNKPAVVVYNGVPYSYVKNLQGDIVALLDSTGTVVVSYVYALGAVPSARQGLWPARWVLCSRSVTVVMSTTKKRRCIISEIAILVRSSAGLSMKIVLFRESVASISLPIVKTPRS